MSPQAARRLLTLSIILAGLAGLTGGALLILAPGQLVRAPSLALMRDGGAASPGSSDTDPSAKPGSEAAPDADGRSRPRSESTIEVEKGRLTATPVPSSSPSASETSTRDRAPEAEIGADGEATTTLARPTPRLVTATPRPPTREAALPQAVDWPDLPELEGREAQTRTQHFEVFAADPEDEGLNRLVERWTPELEDLLREVGRKLGDRSLPNPPVDLVFTRSYEARCPARGLAAVYTEPPLLLVFVDDGTSETQIRAVLAHELAHHLSLSEDFVGDGLLTEGIANWGADRFALAWQGWSSWDEAVLAYLEAGRYVSIADDTALQPRPGEDCIPRRDRVYNIRTAFVDWLIERIGLDTVLAMPQVALTEPDGEGGETQRILPDYETATGLGLIELEQIWLAELRASAGIDAW